MQGEDHLGDEVGDVFTVGPSYEHCTVQIRITTTIIITTTTKSSKAKQIIASITTSDVKQGKGDELPWNVDDITEGIGVLSFLRPWLSQASYDT